MIRLKTLLNEIDITKSSHFSVEGSFRLFSNLDRSFMLGSAFDSLMDKIVDGKVKTFKDANIANLFAMELASVKPIKVPGRSDLIIYRCDLGEGDDGYALFNTKETIEKCFVGFIKATRVGDDGYSSYSPKATFKIKGIVRRVHLSEVAKEYLGQGYGSILYNAMWDDSGAIASDSILFKGSFAMWTKKIMSEASFFGLVVSRDIESTGSNRIIIPLTPEQARSNKVVGSQAGRAQNYIAIKGEVPEPMRKVAYNLKGVNPATELVVCSILESIKTKEVEILPDGDESYTGTIFDLIDNCDNLFEFFDQLNNQRDITPMITYGRDHSKKNRVAIILFLDATLIIKDLGTGKLVNILV